VNNRTLFTLSPGKYYVKEIDYSGLKIRLSDPGVVEDTSCSFPRYFLNKMNILYLHNEYRLLVEYFPQEVGFLNCSKPVSDDPRYVEVKSGGCDFGGHIYAMFDPAFRLMDLKAWCRIKIATFAHRKHDWNFSYVSYADILKSLEEGFWLYWFPLVCRDHCGKHEVELCFLNNTTPEIKCRSKCYIADHICPHGKIFPLLLILS